MLSCLQTFSKEKRFEDLALSAEQCNLCPRLCDRVKVLSNANGNLYTKVVFIAEAPGRLGADRTKIPLYGDRTGDNFEKLLGNIGWTRDQIFITNAVLCNPRQDNGNNGTPTLEEIENSSAYLEMVISLIKPDVIVTLGAIALKALGIISPHRINLRDNVAKVHSWNNLQLFPLYHPAPRALIHRSILKQRSDFMRLSKLVHPLSGLIKTKKINVNTKTIYNSGTTPIQQVIRTFLDLGQRMTYFKLTKLLYLFDLHSQEKLGYAFASDTYLRQVDGPWPPSLYKAISAMDGYEVKKFFSGRIPCVQIGPSSRTDIHLTDEILEIITEVWDKYQSFNNSAIKVAAYRTEPMQLILEAESQGKKMLNKPIVLKKNKSILVVEHTQ
jgi:uracil-DNA glycosylase family 4